MLMARSATSWRRMAQAGRHGDIQSSGDIRPGNCLRLADIPAGTAIHNVELKQGKGGQLVRSAGVSATLMAKDSKHAQVKLPSGEVRKVHINCRATVGRSRTWNTRT